jgi:hypothetical protein
MVQYLSKLNHHTLHLSTLLSILKDYVMLPLMLTPPSTIVKTNLINLMNSSTISIFPKL